MSRATSTTKGISGSDVKSLGWRVSWREKNDQSRLMIEMKTYLRRSTKFSPGNDLVKRDSILMADHFGYQNTVIALSTARSEQDKQIRLMWKTRKYLTNCRTLSLKFLQRSNGKRITRHWTRCRCIWLITRIIGAIHDRRVIAVTQAYWQRKEIKALTAQISVT